MKSVALCVAVLTSVGGVVAQRAASPSTDVQLTVTGKATNMLGRGRVSPDGNYISFEDQWSVQAGGTGNLAIWNTRTNETRIVNRFSNSKPWGDGVAESSTWSPDGDAIAYGWAVEGQPKTRELRIVDVSSGRHRTLFRTAEGETRFAPFAFAPDGRNVLVAIGTSTGASTIAKAELALISTTDGARKVLRTFDGHMPLNATFSPAGDEVAFDVQSVPGSPARDINSISLARGTERGLVSETATHEVLLAWLNAGQLVYTSSRNNQTDAFALRVTASTVERPVLVRTDVGQVEPLGVTRDGRLFVQKTAPMQEIYIAEIDPSTGKARRPAKPLPNGQRSDLRSEPKWSPDGLRIAYVRRAVGAAQQVVVQTVATGEARPYDVPVANIDWAVWARDGKSLYFDGTDMRDKVQRTSRLDLETGRVEAASNLRRVILGFSPDDRYKFEIGGGRGLERIDRATGSSEVLGAGGRGIALSPDAQWVAYLLGAPPDQFTLTVRRVTGGEERILLEKFPAGYPRLTWTPDSRYVIFNVNPEGLHRISIDGGPKESLSVGAGLGWITEKTMNVNGRDLAFAVTGATREVWIWSGLVPGRTTITGRR